MATLHKNKRAPVRRTLKKSPSPRAPKDSWYLDKNLVFITFAFVVFGLIFTYSSSAFDSASYFKRQVVFNITGLISAGFLARYYLQIQRKINPMVLVGIATALLVIVLFCPPVANVHRWISLGFFNLQPSELAKPVLLIYTAYYVSNMSVNISKSFAAIVPPLAVTGVMLGLMLLAPDLGTPFLMFVVVYIMLIAAGARIKHLFFIFLAAVPLLLHQLIFYPYRLARLFSFMSPEATQSTTGYQLYQSFLAIGSGGWLGKGLGNSELKLQYLPAAHTDFIFAVICEELGLAGAILIVALFVWFFISAMRLVLKAKDSFNSMLALGITMTITLQAFFNMGVAVGILPTKGLPLPFFSYGGSSVIVTLAMMGILINLSAEERRMEAKFKKGKEK